MKNRIRLLAAIIILFVVFTICYFVIPFPHKSTAVFVLMYIFTAIAIIAQLYPLYVTFFQSKRLNNVVYSADKYKNYPEGKQDNTHLRIKGAKKICEILVEQISKNPTLNIILKR